MLYIRDCISEKVNYNLQDFLAEEYYKNNYISCILCKYDIWNTKFVTIDKIIILYYNSRATCLTHFFTCINHIQTNHIFNTVLGSCFQSSIFRYFENSQLSFILNFDITYPIQFLRIANYESAFFNLDQSLHIVIIANALPLVTSGDLECRLIRFLTKNGLYDPIFVSFGRF